jgi:hypothetical protein
MAVVVLAQVVMVVRVVVPVGVAPMVVQQHQVKVMQVELQAAVQMVVEVEVAQAPQVEMVL